jgi:hypothetical protein
MDPMYHQNLGAEMMMGQQPPMPGEPSPKTPDQIVDDEIRDMILKRKEASRSFYQDKRTIQDKCWNHYKQVYDTTNKEAWQSTIFIPASPKVAEVITSNMHAAQLGPDRPVEYQARQPIFEEPVRAVNDILAVDMERSNFKVHWTDITRSKVIIGTGIGKIEYRKEYADVQVKERNKPNPLVELARRLAGFPPPPTETVSVKRMVVKDHASTTYVDRYDCFPEPGTVEISKDKWFIERGKICNYRLIELAREQENPVIGITDELLMNNPKQLKDPDGDKAEKNAALGEMQDETAYMDPDQEHELLEYWGPAPLWMVQPEFYGDESKKYEMVHAWFWLIDGQYVVRRQNTPWRDAEPPYVKDVYIRVPGQFDGIGALEIILGLQIELNEGVNCRQDEINLKLNSPTAVLKDAVPEGDYSRIVNGPGALWGFSGIDDIRKAFAKIELDGNLMDSWRSSQMVEQQIQETSGAVKATIGAGGSEDEAGGGTFRGQLLNKQVASERFIMYARTSEIMGLAQAARKMYQRIYQFKGYDEVGKILGEERAQRFEFVPPEQLESMAKLVPMGVTNMENKGVKLAQMAEQFKMFMGQPWFKPVEHARRMMVVGGDDADLSIMNDEELKLYNQAKRQMIGEAGVPPEPPMGGPSGGPPSSPVAGNVPGPTDGQPRPSTPARGPGASPIDGQGMPV